MTPRVHAALLVIAAAATAHFLLIGPWVVDDAAIAWAFARNWADGHGLVPFAGGERVEGYSDFLWVAALALGERAGVDAWAGAKLLGSALGVLTVPLVYHLGAAAFPRRPVLAGIVAAATFALDTQMAVFGASGLENPLFSFLLALGLARAEVEHRTDAAPWSALAFLGVATTRPEGIVYAAVAGFAALCRAPRDRRGAGIVAAWLALFWVPFLGYHAARYAYFAWPYPMTYYAKVRGDPRAVLDGASQAWRYVLDYVTELHRGWFLPILLAGRLPLDRHRVLFGGVLVVGLVLAFAPLPASVFAVGFLALGATLAVPGWTDRGAAGVSASAGAMGLTAAGFALFAQGDWMSAWRWMSFAVVPFAVLFGAGASQLTDLVASRLRGRAADLVGGAIPAACVAAFAVPNLQFSAQFARNPDINPFSVRERVAEATGLWRTLHDDSRPRVMTVDMGGFMWFSSMELMDFVGLVDVTYAQQSTLHRPQLTDDWLSRRHQADFVFVYDAEASFMRRRPVVHDAYVARNPQQFVRRALLFAPREGRGEPLALGPVDLFRLEAPGGPVSDVVYVELDVSTPTNDPFSARLFLAPVDGPPVASYDVPLGAGLVLPHRWRPTDVFVGRFHLDLPDDLAPGAWRLGVRLVADGVARTPEPTPGWTVADGILWPDRAHFTVAAPAQVDAALDALVADALADAAEGRCDEAERRWFLARRRHLDPGPVDARHAASTRRALASCLSTSDDVVALARARSLDPDAPGVAAALTAAATRLQATCDNAERGQDWSACVDACDAVMTLDPTRSHTRRRAETCRAHTYAEFGPSLRK